MPDPHQSLVDSVSAHLKVSSCTAARGWSLVMGCLTYAHTKLFRLLLQRLYLLFIDDPAFPLFEGLSLCVDVALVFGVLSSSYRFADRQSVASG